MYISPKRGHSMTAWSLEKFVPPSTPCVLDQECYFVFYARGQGDGEHTFWVELKVRACIDTVPIVVVLMGKAPVRDVCVQAIVEAMLPYMHGPTCLVPICAFIFNCT